MSIHYRVIVFLISVSSFTTIHCHLSPPSKKIVLSFFVFILCVQQRKFHCVRRCTDMRDWIFYTQEQTSIFLYGFTITCRYLHSERGNGSARVPGHALVLRDVAHDGVSCTFSNRSARDWCKRSGGMDRPSRSNHTLLGHSPPASQAGRRIGPAL